MSHHTNEELRAELKSLADTLESVLNTAESKSKEEVDSLKKKAQAALENSRTRLAEGKEQVVQQTKEIAGKADNYVRENPWTSVGIGAAVGVVLGVLLARR
ncbi:DUF883 family protein [Morganella morganii]|uniref:DUF883 family protein n=1 Tax=Morganella morganii TaxID=582 RepID=UPI000509C709|nr:YqjD family protein [Morganella morganii]MBT0332589.1 DUF883 domain-containing protein [Morganella morganii subsp. morganii]MBT0355432.1 DUF883 domain-containing protein [Morganella morganii subsp. morganii]WHZ54427.1 YqjD family protein [Morganella morganii]HBU8231723.1 DUF883 domain-containing protein [Morganella morganii]